MNRRLLVMLAALVAYSPAVFADDGWRFRLTPYIWLAGLKGDVATIPGSPAVPIDISPSDALSDTETGVMVMLDARKGRHGVYTDFMYTDVRSDTTLLPAPINLTLRSVSKTTAFTAAYQYEIYNDESAFVDLLAGARYWDIDSELNFGRGLGQLATKKLSHDESWVDPLIGVKGRTALGDTKFFLAGGAGVGGFGAGSDTFYEWNVAAGYLWSKTIGTAVGYRMFKLDYEDGGFIYDVKQEGWQVGLTWFF